MNLNDLLLNIFVNFFFVLSLFPVRSNRKYKNLLVGLVASVSVILCMTFPIYQHAGYRFDLRVIPLVLGIILGGRRVGVMVTVVFVAYRLLLGGGEMWAVFAADLPAAAIAFYFVDRFPRDSPRRRLIVSVLIAAGAALISTAVTVLNSDGLTPQMKWMISGYVLLHVLTMWITVYLYGVLKENEDMRREMQLMEKQHVMSQLAASIAHEVRNPMTVVKGFMQLLDKQLVIEKNREYLRIMVDELDRAESILRDYLDFARPTIESIREVDVEEKVRQVSTVMNSYALYRDVEFEVVSEGPLITVTDGNRLSQVLMNLCKNGIEAMPDGGRLRLRASRRQDEMRIEIADTGIGMTADELARLGNPFYSTKDKGTGLGLMVTYRMIEAMNGRITVTSEKGTGTRFVVHLPIVRES
jgi:two-component system, sporulation sensor kinase B